jgi:hypothetical protein
VKSWKITISAFLCTAFAVSFSLYADSPSDLTKNDPLVTLSYVEKVREELKNEIINELTAKIEDIKSSEQPAETIDTPPNFGYKIVELTQGQTLFAGDSCEIIVRTGSAFVVVTDVANIKNLIGISDLTDGKDLLNSAQIPLNHYIIIPRGDGRGIGVTSATAFIMIRGEYTIVTE